MRGVAQVFPIVMGITLCTASAALFYQWYRTRKSKRDELDGLSTLKFAASTRRGNETITLRPVMTNEKVVLVCGRAGANVRAIEETTGVRITFKRTSDTHQTCEIAGAYENAMKAFSLINDELARSESVTQEMHASLDALKVITRGKWLQDVCKTTNTKIHLDAGRPSAATDQRRITLTGGQANVARAIQIIGDKIAELPRTEPKREPRIGRKTSPSPSLSSNEPVPASPRLSRSADLLSNGDNFTSMSGKVGGKFDVFVSAVASPDRFWIQMVGAHTAKLDDLIAEMTAYYAVADHRAQCRIKDPYLGQIVAALFQHDNKWYRAEVVGIVPNEFDPRKVVLDLYFLDYGDSIYVQPDEVFEIQANFLTLRYQAIECFLANVQPANNTWSNDATSRFEDITHVARWQKLIAKIVTTKERVRSNPGQRGGSPIPGIELYELVDDHEVSLGDKLILENFAVPKNGSGASTPLSRYSSTDNVHAPNTASSPGSVAEKTKMFELTASLSENFGSSPKLRVNASADESKSPRFSAGPQKNLSKGY